MKSNRMSYAKLFVVTLLTLLPVFGFSQSRDSGGAGARRLQIEKIRNLLIGDQKLLKVSMLNYLKALDPAQISDRAIRYIFLEYPGTSGLQKDIEISDYVIKDGQCRDIDKKSVAASAFFGNKGGPICFDSEKIVDDYPGLSAEQLMIQLAALAFHEHLHHFQHLKNGDRSQVQIYERQAYDLATYVQLTAVTTQLPVLTWTPENQGNLCQGDGCRVFSDENFKACYRIYERNLAANVAADLCIEKSKNFKFFGNKSFNNCFKIYDATSISAEAASNVCMKMTATVDFSNPNYLACYNVYKDSLPTEEAVSRCITQSRSFRFLNNTEFSSCLRVYRNSLDTVDAANRCMALCAD